MATSKEKEVYRPQDALSLAFQALMITGGAGLLVSGVQNTLQKQNIGAMGVFTRSGGTIATFGKLPCLCQGAMRRVWLTLVRSCDGWSL
jgi:hypothetical protein